MIKKKKSHRPRAHLYPVIAVALFLGLAIVFYFTSNPYTTLVKPNFSGFSPENAQESNIDNAEETLSVWLDMSPSMYGYLGKMHPNCVPSSYKMILQQMPAIAKSLSKLATPAYYRFTSSYEYLQTVQDSDRAAAREKLTFNPLHVENKTFYAADIVKGGQSVSIPSVLNTLDVTHPTLILTDWEEDGMIQPNGEYAQPLKRIFNAGYCMSVVAMRSAFGGVLYNYTNEGNDYGYANSHEKTAVTELGLRNPYHNQPRPFYAIIIGTADQCKTLTAAVTRTYQQVCDLNITSKIEQINKAYGCNASAADFVQLQTTTYLLNDNFATRYAINGQTAIAENPVGMTLSAVSDWASKGTPQYTIIRQQNNDAQTASVTLRIQPGMASYDQTYTSDTFTIPALKVSKMETSKISDATLPESETILLARGPRRIQLQLVDFADTNQWFTCSPVSPGSAYASFQLMIQAGSCDPGLYRVVIPVICRHSTEVPELSDSSWVASWSIQASMLKATMAKEIVPLKTVNLEEQTNTIRKAEIKAGSGKDFLLAQLTVDIIIQ